MWTLPVLVFAIVLALAIPLGRWMSWTFDGQRRLPGWLRWIEGRIDTGPQNW